MAKEDIFLAMSISPNVESFQCDPRMATAVASAIEESIAAASVCEARVNQSLAIFDMVLGDPDSGDVTPEAVVLLRNALDWARSEAASLFDRQREVLGTVNIVLFGRTSAGKSSLIESLSHGTGTAISDGPCDFTVDVTPRIWHGVRFMDTPGICGWGRSMNREELEARARRAAEVADIVVLCFDDSSQLQSEFDKVAAWVKEFGKPVIAVLNIKSSPNWRWPGRVGLGSRRRELTQRVREHASHITSELAAIGIHDAPVIAIAAQRAVYARTDDNYAGPIPEQCATLREMLGRSELLRQSNLEVFEEIVIEALTSHAVEIRLAMLHAQVRALLERLLDQLRQAGAAAKTAADALDASIKSILEIVGYPAEGSERRAALAASHTAEDPLTAAEQARGDAYTMSTEGRAARYTRQRCGSEFGTLRSRSIAAANREINDGFDRRTELDPESFARRVYDNRQIEATARAVLTEGAAHLQRELKLALADAKLDLEFSAWQTTKVSGNAGQVTRYSGVATRVAAMLAGAATLLVFTPEPVISKGAALVLGIIAGALGWFGEWLTGKAKDERARAKANAFAEATRAVNGTYDQIAEQIDSSMAMLVLEASKEALPCPLRDATSLWKLTAGVSEAQERLAGIIDQLPAPENAQRLLDGSARRIAERRGVVHVDRILLGEDWVTDPTGLRADTGSAEPHRTRANDADVFERLFSGFQRFVFQFTGKVHRGAGSRWLAETELALSTEEMATAAIEELRQILLANKPRYHLLGDYSTGKTTFIKRLLMDAGLPLPGTLEVRADPATDSIHPYEWEDALLVDCPGLQSGRDEHASAALDSVPDASVLICLFQPSLLVGATDALEQVLKGDPEKGLAAKFDRTIFVIHRSDQLGPDPELVPKHYVHVCNRKRLELQQALGSKGINVEISRIVCMAADPRGMVGNRRDANSAEFDPFRRWDGFKEFHSAIRAIHVQSAATGIDYSLLEGGLARLGRIAAKMQVESEDMERQEEVFASRHRVFRDIIASGELLEGDLKDQARKLVEDYAQGLRSMETHSDEELRAKVAALAKWWDQPSFKAKAEHWQAASQQMIEKWWVESSERLNRSLSSPRFKAAVASASESLDQSPYAPGKPGPVRRVLDLVAAPLKGATRDVVYQAGKSIGQNFKPWGAVKLARNLSRVGVALGAALTLWDAVRLFNFFKEEKRSEQREKELDNFINKTTDQVFISITQSGDESEGPLEALALLRQELQAAGQALASERDSINESLKRIQARHHRVRKCMTAAWDALGQPVQSQ